MLGEGSVPGKPRPGSSSPASGSRLLPSPAAGGTAATHGGLFSVGSINSVPSEPWYPMSPLPLAHASLNFPNEFGEMGVFSPQNHPSFRHWHTGGEKVNFPRLPLWDKIRRAPPPLQKPGKVLPSLPCPVSFCVSRERLHFHRDNLWQGAALPPGEPRQGRGGASGTEPWAPGKAPARHGLLSAGLMEVVLRAGYVARASEKGRCHLHPAVCLVRPGNTWRLGTAERAGLFLTVSPLYPHAAQGMGSATSPPSRHLR